MTVDDLRNILVRGEGLHSEFKESGRKVPVTFYHTVVSFLNREGGIIVLGADDHGSVTGIGPDVTEQMQKDIITSLNNKDIVNPPVNFPVYRLEYEGKTVLCIKVPVSSQIHSHVGVIYDREHDSDIRIDDDVRISDLYFRKRNHFTENEIFSHLYMEDLAEGLFDKTRLLVRSVNVSHPWLESGNMEILRSCGFYRRDNRTGEEGLTLAAALVFGKDSTIQNIIPAYKFDVLVRVKDRDRWDDKLTLRTNLIDTYLQVMDFIRHRSHLPDKFYLEGDQRKDLRELIFREIVVNLTVHREYTSAYPTTLTIYDNRVEATNPNKPLFRGVLSPDAFDPYAKNPNIRRFFSEFRWADEIGSGVRNVHKYLNLYVPGAKPLFIEGDQFKTVVPLISSELGIERADIFIELAGLDKVWFDFSARDAIGSLELAPEYAAITGHDELFFNLGGSWSKQGGKYEVLRVLPARKLQFEDFTHGGSWSEKGGKLLHKRTLTILRLLMVALTPKTAEEIQTIIGFGTREKLRELYLQPLRACGFLAYTIKDRPNSPNQGYVTTAQGRFFIGGFEV